MNDSAVQIRVDRLRGAVLFDLDGTLADTDPLHARSWQLAAERLSRITFTWDEYRRACVEGDSTPAEFIATLNPRVPVETIATEKARLFREMVKGGLLLRSGAADLVTALDRAQVPTAVVSGGSARSVETIVDVLWPTERRPLVISRERTVLQKPHPEPYLLAVSLLNRSAEHCVAFEDTDKGIASAQNAGLRTVRITADRPPRSGGISICALDAFRVDLDDSCVLLTIDQSRSCG